VRVKPRSNNHSIYQELPDSPRSLLYVSTLAFESFPSDQVRNVIVIVVLSLLAIFALLFLHALVAFGELSQGREGVWAELVEDAGHELRKFLVLTVTVYGKGVGWNGGVYCCRIFVLVDYFPRCHL
jgi:hypothetical protein